MKRVILAAIAIVVFGVSMAQTESKYDSYVQVSGVAEMEVKPNLFYLSITIDEADSKGKISVAEQQRQMITALTRLGVDVAEQLEFTNVTSDYFRRGTSVATGTYQLKLMSSEMVAKAWQALDALGISRVALSRVENSDMKSYISKLRAEAVQNAKKNAQELGEALGQTVGQCFYIYDSNYYSQLPAYDGLMLSARTKSAGSVNSEAMEVDFKSIKLRCDVNAKFILNQ